MSNIKSISNNIIGNSATKRNPSLSDTCEIKFEKDTTLIYLSNFTDS